MSPRQLVLLVEGEGDVDAVPQLVRKSLASLDGWWEVLHVGAPMRVGSYPALERNGFAGWKGMLEAAARRQPGACVAVLDGDSKWCRFGDEKRPFCPVQAARRMAEEARSTGAGSRFSLAVVFARCEFESWLIAGLVSVAGRTLGTGRLRIPDVVVLPPDPENAPRDAKGWLANALGTNYRPARHQETLAKALSVEFIRSRNLSSFGRFERALREVVDAVRSGQHVSTPGP